MSLAMQQHKVVNKSCLIDRVAVETGMPVDDVSKVMDTMLKTISRSMKEHESVSIRGFGSWRVGHFPEKEIYSPLLGKKVMVAQREKVIFKPGTQLQIVRE